MKILITGKDGYIGTYLKTYLERQSKEYEIDTISVRDEAWKKMNFDQYEIVIHLAAIVHRKPHEVSTEIYRKINGQLPIEIATKAKAEHVKQFIFMSTMAVYGEEGKIGKKVIIDENTPCEPVSSYGKSKLEAEEGLNKLKGDNFTISIIRPPMVYGPKCVGNYKKLSSMVKKLGIFPAVNNERSMIYITNLCECIHLVMRRRIEGIIHPHDAFNMNTTELVMQIANVNGMKIRRSKVLAWMIKYIGRYIPICNKVFGNLVYEFKQSHVQVAEYAKVSFKDAIMQTEGIG